MNQAALQIVAAEEFILLLGHVAPPIVLGTDEQKREQVKGISFVPVRPIARVGLTRQRVEELLHLFEGHLKLYDERQLGD